MAEEQPKVEKLISAKQVGQMLGLNAKTVIRMVESGELPGYKFNYVWRFKQSEIEAYIETHRYKPNHQ